MKKKYSVLHKKVQELEAELRQLFSLPHDHHHYHHDDDDHDGGHDQDEAPSYQILLSQDIEQRFIFLRSLLSAEISSSSSVSSPNPKKKPSYHLLLITRRLDELETKFKDWENLRASGTPLLLLDDGDHHHQNDDNNNNNSKKNDDDDATDRQPQNDAGASCSCGNGDIGGGNDVDGEDSSDQVMGNGDVEREEEKPIGRNLVGKSLGFMGVGFLIGVGLMGLVMVRFCGCFEYCCYYYYGNKLGLVPPT